MNLVLLPPENAVAEGVYELGERHAKHAREIWKSRPGDVVRVGRLGGNRGTARVVALERDALRLEVEALDDPPPPPLGIDLAVALPRPPILRRSLQQATSLGVKRIHVFGCTRVEKSFWSSRQLRTDEIREQLVLGLEQAGDTVLPEVMIHRRFRDFCEEVEGRALVVADPSGVSALPSIHGSESVPIAIVGPEGGFVRTELEALAELRARIVMLGPRLLRVDTACVVLLTRLVK